MRKISYQLLRSFLALMALSVLAASPASAGPAASPKSFLVRPWSVGQSATYLTKTFHGDQLVDTETVTYSIVGLKVIDNRDYFWVEIEDDQGDGVTIIQKLEELQPDENDFGNNLMTDYHFWTPRRRIQEVELPGPYKRSSVNEFVLSPEEIQRSGKSPFGWGLKKPSFEFSITPARHIRVEAGEFDAEKFHRDVPQGHPLTGSRKNTVSIDVWGSPEVPVLGLVKKLIRTVDPEHNVVVRDTELVSYSESGAYSKIKGKVHVMSLKEQAEIRKLMIEHGSRFYSGQGNNE